MGRLGRIVIIERARGMLKLNYHFKKHVEDILCDCTNITRVKKYDNIAQTVVAREYYNLECSFDIETTSYFNSEGDKRGTMYCWQFAVKGNAYLGRTWSEFLEFINILKAKYQLSDRRRLIIYVHNLSFEFQWFRKWLNITGVFATESRKVLYCIVDACIEFRCSYFLSGMSLEKTADNLVTHKIAKASGDLDYRLIRHSKTPLTQKEQGYCIRDVLIVTAYINEQISLYGDITRIPMTNTGRVRAVIKQAVKEDEESAKWIRSQTITYDEYIKARFCFQGGFTHANSNKVFHTHNNVSSYDFTSSYPAVMLSEKFPSRQGVLCQLALTQEDIFRATQSGNIAYIFGLELNNVTEKFTFEHYLSSSKCYELSDDAVIDNGRIVSASHLKTVTTSVDLRIIHRCYNYDEPTILGAYMYTLDYLPLPYVEQTIDFYNAKTTLKGVEGKEAEYQLKKGMLNSLYGMTVTDILQDLTEYKNGKWSEQMLTDIEKLQKIDKYNKSKNKFYSYLWGVFITAYARRNLWSGIFEYGEDYIYSDTDSIKCVNADKHSEYHDRYNKRVTQKITDCLASYGIEYQIPKNQKGKECPLGVWDYEGTYTRFKTLGAKRYLYETADNKLHLTCAGLNKELGCKYISQQEQPFRYFDKTIYVPSEYSGRLESFYIDEEFSEELTDCKGVTIRVTELSSVCMNPEAYSFDYEETLFIKYLQRKGVI